MATTVKFGAGRDVVSGTWTDVKAVVLSKDLMFQYTLSSGVYTIFAYDDPLVYVCNIWTGTVPDGVVNGGYSQSQNDTDKSDFETNYQPSANGNIVQSVGSSARATFAAEGNLAGANNKDMLSILNPSGSGKILKVRKAWAVVPSSSGATVIIPFELRSATAVGAGTVLTAKSMDSTNASAVAVVRTAPTSITDSSVPLFWTWIEQINTAQGGTENMSHTLHNSSAVADVQPITLRPGEALYMKQVASNTSTFRMGVLWTEE